MKLTKSVRPRSASFFAPHPFFEIGVLAIWLHMTRVEDVADSSRPDERRIMLVERENQLRTRTFGFRAHLQGDPVDFDTQVCGETPCQLDYMLSRKLLKRTIRIFVGNPEGLDLIRGDRSFKCRMVAQIRLRQNLDAKIADERFDTPSDETLFVALRN